MISRFDFVAVCDDFFRQMELAGQRPVKVQITVEDFGWAKLHLSMPSYRAKLEAACMQETEEVSIYVTLQNP